MTDNGVDAPGNRETVAQISTGQLVLFLMLIVCLKLIN